MKKNFFKKLSFVIALAMIVSVVAPAAGAFAAAAAKLNATKKYLVLGDDFDFNVINGQKGWKYKYTSSKTSVATVTGGTGVITTKAIGTTTITLKASKDGKVVKTLKATVIVKDPMTSITLTNKPEKELKVGDVNDFGRTFKTVSGSTKKTSTITRYAVDSDKAEINPVTGVFTAKEAGEYNVKVLGFQTVAQYNAWVAAKDFASTKSVVVSDTAKVVVAPSITSVEQTSLTKFAVTFDSDMSKTDVATKGLVYQVFNGKDVLTGTEKIKKIELDSTGKVATVEMYVNFNQKAEYKFVYGTLSGSFTAATVALSEIDSIVFSDFNVDPSTGAGYDMTKNIVAKNAKGVVIYTGADTEFANALTFTYTGENTKGLVSGKMAYIYSEGYTAVVKAKFETWVLNTATNKYEPLVKEAAATAIGVKANTNISAASIQYIVQPAGATAPSIAKDTKADWSKTSFVMAAGDNAFVVYKRYKTNDDADTWKDTTTFSYKSTDENKLLISGSNLVPLKEGNVTVIVSAVDGTKVTPIGSFDVTIAAARSLAGIEQDKAVVKVGNNGTYGETAEVKVFAKDTMNDKITSGITIGTPTVTNWPSNSTANAIVVTNDAIVTSGDDAGLIKYKAYATAGAKVGVYQVKSTITYANVSKDVYFTVQVGESNDATHSTAVNYEVVLGKTSVDLKNTDAVNEVSVTVYGINAEGLRVSKLTDDQFDIVLTKDGKEIDKDGTDGIVKNVSGATYTTSVAVVRATTVGSGTVLKAVDQGNYVITVKLAVALPPRAIGSVIAYSTLEVKDTTSKDLGIKTTAVSKATYPTLDVAVKAAFDFKINGVDKAANIVSYKVSTGAAAAAAVSATAAATQTVAEGSLFIDSVTIGIANATGEVYEYVFTVDRTISITQ